MLKQKEKKCPGLSTWTENNMRFLSSFHSVRNDMDYFIVSNPQYGISTFGILIPSAVWLFSNRQATILGNARALPFRVCANTGFPSPSLKRNFKRLL